ncbi:autotransporter domain-containing protein [Campylobacter sp. VTCC 70190]|uniref:autotransporter outer membrane beta-barrel domain-containing protein n=1 Tax=Campylobacter sp. VTCC 70190 TaxID=3392118 RepID=UPI00398E975A
MKKSLILTSTLFSVASADYTTQLPTSLTLTRDETHNAIISCTYPQTCAFNYNGSNGGYDFTLNGGSNTLTITRQDPATGTQPADKPDKDVPIYFGAFSQNGGTFDIKNFDYFIADGMTLTNQAKLIFTGNNKAGKGFSSHKAITLDNSTLEVSGINGGSFSTSEEFKATNSSKVDIKGHTIFTQDATIENSSFTTNSLTIQGVKKDILGNELKLATLTNKGGSITVNGDVKNGNFEGGNNKLELCAMLGTCGNGKIINEDGGTITITGKLINESFEDTTTGQNTHSGLEIQGGKVEVKGGMENRKDSTIDFSQSNGQMGQLVVGGSGLSNQGTINANLNGINQQGTLQLIQGNISGNTDITISGASNMMVTKACPDGSVLVGLQGETLVCPSTGGGGGSGGGGGTGGGGTGGGGSGGGSGGDSDSNSQIQKIESLVFGNSANHNGRALLRSLAMDDIITTTTTTTRQADSGTAFFAMPKSTTPSSNQGKINNFFVVSSYNSNVLADILNDTDKGIRMSYLSLPNASMDAMRDREVLNADRIYPSYDVSSFGSGFLGEGRGYTFGLRLNAYGELEDNLLRLEADLGYSSLLRHDEYHKASSKGQLFGLGLSHFYDFGGLETNNRIYLGYSSFDTSRTIIFPAFNLNSTGDYDFMQVSLSNLLSYELENGFKPFVGIEQFYHHRSNISEKGNAVPLRMGALNAYNLDGILGLGYKGFFEKGYVNLNSGFSATLINTEDRQYFKAGSTSESLSYKAPYKYKFFVNSGLYYYLRTNIVLGLEGFYKNSFNKDELGYFGGNVVFRWEF